MNGKKWLTAFLLISALLLAFFASLIVYIDPFFHYHKPHTDKFYYRVHEQRNINNGIERLFDYDAMIIGSSMTENFRTSELDKLFGTNSIKTSFSGSSLYEANSNIAIAIENNPELKMVVRCLDRAMYFDNKDRIRTDLGVYPEYLYDNYYYNDVNYVFNRELLFSSIYQMIMEQLKNTQEPGIFSFDDYSSWYQYRTLGPNVIYPDKSLDLSAKGSPIHISGEEVQAVVENIEQNVCSLARENPQVEFYYYLPPYSAAWWQQLNESGEIYKYLEAERIVIEQILSCENIKLFSMSTNVDITSDLNNYDDRIHYGPWINSLILIWMKEGEYLLTEDNYEVYLSDLEKLYTEFDYNSLLQQKDHSNDIPTIEKYEKLYGYTLGEY